MYYIEMADIYKDELTWAIEGNESYDTEKAAYKAIAKMMEENYDCDCLGRYVYRVIKKDK